MAFHSDLGHELLISDKRLPFATAIFGQTRRYSGEQSTAGDKEELGQTAEWTCTDLSLPLTSAEFGSQAYDVIEGPPAGLPQCQH